MNPPLFVWAEWQSFRLTGDLDRVRRVVPALREHIDWFSIVRWAQESVHKLYWNEMFGSGNETLPRPYGRYSDGGKVYGDPDTSAMVAQAYLLLGDLYDQLGDTAEAAAMRAIGEAITDRINRYLWKTFTVDGTTYGQWFYATYNGSIAPTSGAYVDEPQTASLWVMTLGVDDAAKREQVKRLLDSEDWYNTDVPLGTLPKSHSQYQGWGGYGLGQVMSPYTYVAIKGAETLYGYEYAQGFSEKYLDGIAEVYEYSDTIWEHYAPDKQTHTDITNALYYQGVLESHRTSGRADCTTHTAPTNAEERWGCEIVKTGYTLTAGNYAAPARRRNVAYEHEPGGVYNSIPSIVKPDFVGWGGIGPIALLIENVIGIQPDSIDKEITWHMTRTDRHGLNNLWLGGDLGKIDLIAAARTDSYSPAVITVTSANADTTTTTTATLKIIHPSYEDCTTVHVITLNQANQQFTSQPCNRGLVVLSPAELVVAEGATGTYTVALGTEPSADVTVTISGQAGTDVWLSGLTNNRLTFTTGNWDTSQTVTVTAAQDTDEVDDVVTLTHTTTSTDTDYAGLTLGIPVTVDDDDTAVVLVSNSGQSRGRNATYSSDHGQAFTTGNNSNGYTVASVTVISEDPDNDPIELKICEVDADGDPTAVCTDLTPPDSFARGPLVFTVPDGPTFAPGTTYMVVFKTPDTGTVRVGTTSSDSEDSTSLPGWSIRNKFQWNSPNGGWQDAADDNAIRIIISGVVIADDEVAGVTVEPDTGLSVGEGDTGTYTVVLDSQPSGAVTVTAASADVGAVTVTPASLTFTSANWATAQTVTVTAEQDDDASAESVNVSHTVSSADTAYNNLAVDVVTVTVADDEAIVAGGLALGMPVTVSGGVSGDAFSVVDGVGDTFVEVGGSWSVVVDLGDAFELSSVGVAPPSGGVLGGVVVSGRLGSLGVWTEFGRAGVGGGSVSVTGGGLFRWVRVVPVTALVSGVTNRVGEVVVWGFESKRVSDFDPVLSGSLSGAGFSSRLESWSFSDGALSPDSGSASVLVADLCSECDLGHEALVEATVRMLVEFPATNPHDENSSSVNLSVGLEEGAGRRRGVVARLFPWMTFDRGRNRGPLWLGMYCGGGSGGADRLRAEGVNLGCTGGVVEGVVDHTPQDVDVSLVGQEVWVELEYRNLKLWVRVWDKDGVRPVLPQAGMAFGPAHHTSASFNTDEDWVLNPARLVIRSWGWDTGMVKVKDVEVTGMVKGPRRGLARGSDPSGLDFRGRYSPLGREVVDAPVYATDRANGLLPEAVLDGSPEYVSIYDKAWELAYTRTRKPSTSQPWYRTWIDEAFNDKLFQWDMASMMWFAKYMHQAFDAMGSMDIFYQTQRDGGDITRRFRESNGAVYNIRNAEVNPPLFVWAEWQSFRLTGDLDRVKRVLPALREYIDWYSIVRWSQNSVHKLYWNEMRGSGNETLPRPYQEWRDGGKVWADPDTSAMIAQAYLLLGELYDTAGDTAEAADMRAVGEAITDRINRYMWKTFTVDGTTYGQWFYVNANGDIAPSDTARSYVDEPQTASLWVMTLGVDDATKREQIKRLLDSEDWYNTDVPLGTLPKSHSQYQGWGGYGLGQVMSPYTYVAIKGAETLYGYEYAQDFSEKYLDGIAEVYKYSDTIWEHYAPDKQTHTDITNALYYVAVLEAHRTSGRADCTTNTAPTGQTERWGCKILKTGYTLPAGDYAAPARRRNVAYEHEPGGVYNSIPSTVKQDFVGWGGIGPIALLIENVIGIQPDSIDKTITWHMTRTDRHGLNNLWLGGDLGKIDLIAAARTDSYSPAVITVTSANADTTTTTTATLKIIHPSYEDCTTVHVITLNQANQQFTSQPCNRGLVVLSPAELVVAEGATGTYTVALGTEPSADVTVTISGQAGTDVWLSGLTNNRLTFTTGNWDTSQTVTVTAAQDTDEVDDVVTLTHTTTSTDTDYAGLALGIPVTVDDDDTAVVLVSNSGQSRGRNATYSSDHGQAFTTGNNSNGYAVASVTVISEDPDNDPIELKICEVDADGAPTAVCTDLTPPDSFARGPLVFTVPDGPTFAPGTTYMVVFKTPDTGTVRVGTTSSDSEDSTSLPGWSIRNKFQWNSPNDGWQDTADDNAIRIIISGVVIADDEVAGVTVEPDTGLPVGEGGTGSYTVVLDSQPSGAVTVTAASADVGAVTVTPTVLTFTPGNWATAQTVTVTALDDDDADDESVDVSHTAASSADAAYDSVTVDSVTVTVTDDDTAGVTIVLAASLMSPVGEGGTGSYTVVLDSQPSGAVTVTAASADSGAVTVTPVSLTFTSTNWATAQTVTVTAVDDDDADDESVDVWHLAASADSAYNLAGDVVTVTVTDDDDAGVTVVPDTGLPVGEGGTGTYTVVLDSQPSGAVTVNLVGSGDVAAVTVTPTVLTFTTGNWATAQTVTVTALDDDDADDESVDVWHTAASADSAYNLAGDVVTVTVTDDDEVAVTVSAGSVDVGEGGTGSYTVMLDSEPSGAVTVTAASADSGAVTVTPTVLTFTTGNWDTAQTVTVTAVDDDDADDESVDVLHTAASTDDAYNGLAGDVVTVTVTDNDEAGVTIVLAASLMSWVGEGGTGSYTVVLDSEPSGAVTVTAASADSGAVTVSPTVLTFTTGNWDTAQTVTVRAEQDDDADDESVDVSHTAASADDAAYNGLAGDVVTVTVTDDDEVAVTVSAGSVDVGEGGTGSYTVMLDSQPSGAVTVTAASADLDAVTVTPTVLTFTTGNWDTAQTVTVTALDDDDADDESVDVSHTAASADDAAYDGLAGDVVTVTVTDNDDAGVTIVLAAGLLSPVGEGGTGSYTVVLDSQPSGAVTVTAASADLDAVTVTPTVLTFTTGNWDTAQTVTVTALDDPDADDESVDVSHTAASADDAAYDGLAGDVVTVTVTDNDDAGVTIVPDTGLMSPVGEGGTGSYTVVLDSQPSGAVTVTAASADSGAVTVTPVSLTFTSTNWATAQTVTVTAVDDDDADDESVDVSYTAASTDAAYNNLAGDVVTVTVTDNDDAGVTIVLAASLMSPVGEGGTGSYTVVLDSQPSGAVTVTAASADSGAVTVTPVSLTFTSTNWATAQTVTVTAVDDDDADDESVDVSYTAASTDAAYNGLAGDVVTVTVTDNDDAGVTIVLAASLLSPVGEGGTGSYTVVLDSQPSETVTVTATSGDLDAVTVTPTVLTFTSTNWAVAQTVTVTAVDDDDADDESVDVSYTAASTDAAYNGLAGDVVTVTVTDNDDAGVTIVLAASLLSPVGEGGTGSYTVVLDSQPSEAVTVTAASADSGAVTVTPTVLTFTTGNWDTAQTVTVTAVDDNDADDESVDVSYTAASSDDAAYNGLAGDVVTVTVTDNDDAGVTIVPDTGLSVGEGGTGSYTVVLDSQPSGAVTVTAASADSGAVTVTPTVLTFTTGNWDTAQTVTVTAVDDNDADDESVDVLHTAASSDDAAYNGLAGDVVTVTVTDNDDAGVTIVPAASLMSPVGEGGTGSYTVVLDSQPSGAVTVTAASADSGAVTVSPTVLTFTTGNWDTAQTVTVTAVDDDDADDESVDVLHTAASFADAVYDGLAGDVVTVTVTDNDEAGVTIVLAASLMSPVGEGGTGSYTVVLASEPSGAVTVTAASADSGAVTVSPTVLTFTTGNWDTAQTVTVTAEQDNDADDESVDVLHTAASFADAVYDGLAGDVVTVTVTDNDDAGVTIVPDTGLSVGEGGTGSYTVVLASEPSGAVTVTAASADSGAVTVSPTVLTFTTGNWDTAQTVTVTAEQDNDADDESVDVSYTAASTDAAYNGLAGDVVTVTVTDNDDAGVTIVPDTGLSVGEGGTGSYTVVLASEPSGAVTVTAASADSGAVTVTPVSLTFTSTNWATAQTVTVTAVDDDDADDESVDVSYTAASTDAAYNNLAGDVVTVTVTDNDDAGVTIVLAASLMSPVGEGGTGSYTVVLDSQPSEAVTVTAASADSGAVTVTPTVLTFTTGNWDTAQTVTVTAVDDDDADDESVDVSYTAASSDDAAYNGLAGDVVTVTVTDNDDAGVTIVLAASLMSPVGEGGTGSYTVVLDSQPSETVTVTATSGDLDAVTVTPTVLTFTSTNWAVAQTVTVTAVDDDDADDESVDVSYTAASTDAAYNGLAGDVVTVTVTDNDDAGVTIVLAASLMSPVGEGGTGSYTVVLDSQPSETVTVTATSGDLDAVTVTPTVLTFTSTNWAVAQTVTVTAEQDDDADDESVDVSYTAASTDAAYNGLAGDVVTVTVTDNDDAGVTIVLAASLLSPVGEGGTGSYTVVLDSQPSETVTVTATSGDLDAVTVTPTVLTFTSTNWATAQTVTVTAVDDDDADDESVDVSYTAASTDAAYNGLAGDVVTVTVTDNDDAGVTIVLAASLLSPVGEGGTGSYTVVLDSQPSETVTVTATSGDLDAVTVTPTVLTFTSTNWATAQTVTVTAEHDNDADDESVDVSYTAASTDAAYNNLAGDVVTVTVTDNDDAGVTIVLAASLMSPVGEGGTGSYTVVLDSQPSGAVTVTAASADSGAVTVTPVSLTFTSTNWATAQTVTVTAEHDNDADDESVDVSYTAASTDAAYNNLAGDVVTVTVTDNDDAGVTIVLAASLMSPVGEGGTGSYTVVLDSQPSGAVTVTATSADTAAVTVTPTVLTFTTGNWDTAQTVTVTAEHDDDADDESVDVSYTAASTDAAYNNLAGDVVTVTVADAEVAAVTVTVVPDTGLRVGEGGTGTYTVVLASEPSGAVTVTATSGDLGAVTVTPVSLTFTSTNWDTAQTVTVTAEHDDDADDESVDVSYTAASTDAAYNNLAGDVVTVTVTDNDDAGVTIVLAASLMSPVGEGGTGSYTVVLDSQPSETVTVTATSGDLDAVTVTPVSLTFTTGNWATAQTVTVTAVDDNDADDESVDVLHTAASSDDAAYNNLAGDVVTVTVTDNDDAGVTIVPDTGLPVGEGDTATYTVVLDSQPSGAVTVTAASADTAAVTVTPVSLTFTSTNWATAQTVTVTAVDDDDADDETVDVSHTVTSADDAAYNSLTVDSVTVTVADAEVAAVTVTVVPDTGLSVGEGDTATYTVVLDSQPSGAVTVTAASADTAAVTVTPVSLTFTSTNWATAQTVTVTALDDADADDETIEVSHGVSSADDAVYDSLTVDSVTVTVTDADEEAAVTVVPDTGLSVGEGGTATYTVVLDSQPSGAVTVTAASADTAAVTVTPVSLTFTSTNWATAQTVTVTAEHDNDADDESVDVSHGVSSADDAVYDSLTVDSVTVTVADAEVAAVTVTVVPDTGLPVGEGDTATYTVVLDSQPSGAVTVTAASADTAAVTVTPVSLTFTSTNWATAQTVTVTALDDADADDETVDVSHGVTSADDAVYDSLTVDSVTVTVADAEVAAVTVTVVPDTGLSVGEGGTATYTVVLDSQPSGAVTVTAASADTAAVTVTPVSLTFTTGNWATAQTVTVTALDDADADDETVEVSHTVTSADDAVYDGLTVDSVTVTVADAEVAAVTVTVVPDTGLSVGEGGTATYTVVLDSQPSGAVTVTAASADTAAVTVTPVSLTFTTGNWATAQTVTVTAEHDNDADDETIEVSHTVTSADDAVYDGLTVDSVTVTVADAEVAAVTVTVVPDTGLSVGEGDTATYTVVLDSQPSGAVTVTAASADTAAVTVTPVSLTFTPGNWATAQTVTVTAEHDNDADDETVEVSHGVSSADDAVYDGLTVDSVTVTVADAEVAAVTVTVVPDTGLSVGEGDTGTYTVVLDSEPSGAVTVTAASGDVAAVTVTPTVLTFTPGKLGHGPDGDGDRRARQRRGR